ncbi:Cytochrome-P450 [Teratosphaeria destructans]|uniref:Cytochrome-P450 n=1 Tax=Teratosphaeria destructans TaxID=418781 RepID=A0A9W7SS64_9PEZI|nr:Cytochrome-P450 [Teratosphaeria destructans]
MASPGILEKLSTSPLLSGTAALLLVLALISLSSRKKSAKIPGIRYGTLPLLDSWQGAWNFTKDPLSCLREGIERYPGGYFKIAKLDQEYVVVNAAEKVAEYLTAKDDVLSVQDAINEGIQFIWTMGKGVYDRPYHIPIVRAQLTQNIAHVVPEAQREVERCLDAADLGGEEWKEVKIHGLVVDIVARTANLAFGGVELAHDEAFTRISIDFTIALMISAEFLKLLPRWAKDCAQYFTPAYRLKKKAETCIGAYIAERLKATDSGEAERRDMLQFLIDDAPAVERTAPQLVERLLALDVAAIHTTTMTVTSALYRLCTYPAETYLLPLRDEIRAVCPSGDLTKEALDRMTRLDSFLRECARLQPIGVLGSARKVNKDFVFKDGTLVPKGYLIAANQAALHESFTDPVFDGFRYCRQADATGGKQPQVVSTSTQYLAFGHGRHACPGRFFAVAEMKTILALMILRYDMKLIPGTAPQVRYFGTAPIPETKLPILVKRVGA